MNYAISKLNQMSQAVFTDALGAVFEDSPWVAERAWRERPFADVAALHQAMVRVVREASSDEQLTLIRAHSDLGDKVQMSLASRKEQAGAGLGQLTVEDHDRFFTLNQAYMTRFGFPFIIAVKNHTPETILQAFSSRLENPTPTEITQALAEIAQITQFRLGEMIE